MRAKKSLSKFVANLGNENRNFYGSPDGRGLLHVIELTFDHRWVYLYELVQNALDVGATSIAIRIGEAGDEGHGVLGSGPSWVRCQDLCLGHEDVRCAEPGGGQIGAGDRGPARGDHRR